MKPGVYNIDEKFNSFRLYNLMLFQIEVKNDLLLEVVDSESDRKIYKYNFAKFILQSPTKRF